MQERIDHSVSPTHAGVTIINQTIKIEGVVVHLIVAADGNAILVGERRSLFVEPRYNYNACAIDTK